MLCHGKPILSWREIAAEAKEETDPKKLIVLVERLCGALETIRLDLVRLDLKRERGLDNQRTPHAKLAAAA